MRDIWMRLLFPVTTLTSQTAHPPLGWTAVLLAVLCTLWGWILYWDTQGRGQRPSRKYARGQANVMWGYLLMAVVLFAAWVLITFVSLLVARLFREDISFDLMFCVLVVGSLPKFLAWAAYTLRNKSRNVYHMWQFFAVVMLVWMTASVCIGLYSTFALGWWQIFLVALPLLAALWSVGILEAREPPQTFRAFCRWHDMEGKNVVLYAPQGTAEPDLEEIVAGSDETLNKVIKLLEVSPLSFKPELFLFPDKDICQKALGLERMTGAGYAHGDCMSSVYAKWDFTYCSLMAHELAHVVCEQSIASHLLPLLDEGLACYIQHRVTPGLIVPAITLPTSLYTLAQTVVFYDWYYTEETEYPPSQKYAHAHALVEYLIHEHGLDKFKQLCTETIKNPTADAGERLVKATKVVYGLSLRDLEKQWRANWKTVARQISIQLIETYVWEQFTAKAQAAVRDAQAKAEALGQDETATEHLLLGLLSDAQSCACLLLLKAGVDLQSLRRTLEWDAARGLSPGGEKTFTADSRRAFELAYDEARQDNSKHIGTEHLLMGLILQETGLAGRTLKNFGVQAAAIRLFFN